MINWKENSTNQGEQGGILADSIASISGPNSWHRILNKDSNTPFGDASASL